MAPITTQESNFTAKVVALAEAILDIKPQIDETLGAWNGNQFGTTIDPDGLADAWNGLTKTELIAAITAFEQIQDAIGDYVSGQASNLVKLRDLQRTTP